MLFPMLYKTYAWGARVWQFSKWMWLKGKQKYLVFTGTILQVLQSPTLHRTKMLLFHVQIFQSTYWSDMLSFVKIRTLLFSTVNDNWCAHSFTKNQYNLYMNGTINFMSTTCHYIKKKNFKFIYYKALSEIEAGSFIILNCNSLILA